MAKRILIAEDQMSTREALTKLAALRGYDVVAVKDGFDLLTVASQENFDVIITDLIMPDLNGASAVEIMKFRGDTTPVIALTGLSDDDLELIETKFTKVYHKPLNVDKMFADIEIMLQDVTNGTGITV
jgi:DNA-binding response OmpR family regulator